MRPDVRLEVALNGAATRLAHADTPVREAVAQFDAMAGGRADLLAAAAGSILGGYLSRPGSTHPQALYAVAVVVLGAGKRLRTGVGWHMMRRTAGVPARLRRTSMHTLRTSRRFATVLIAAALLLLSTLAACGNGSSTDGSSGASTTPSSDSSILGHFDIGEGKKLHLECRGDGPTIVIDNGDGDAVSDGSWQAVSQSMQSIGRVCAYDRANVGSSDPDPGPRTIKDLGDDLVSLLHVAKVPGPYVFVGGSFGGNIVGVLAANHPDEVAGIVFVDSDPVNDDPKLDPARQNLPEKTYKECCAPELYEPPFDAEENVEHIDWKGGRAAAVASVRQLPNVPTIVLTAAKPECQPDWPCEAMGKDIARLQAQWIKGNPHGSQKIIDSGHDLQEEAPQKIVDATRAVVRAARTS